MYEVPLVYEERRQTMPPQKTQYRQSQSHIGHQGNASFGPERVAREAPRARRNQRQPYNAGYGEGNLTEDEPICVLKIELDGQNVEEIKVFENDDPRVIV